MRRPPIRENTSFSAQVIDIVDITAGSEVWRDHVVGETTLEVYDASEFHEEGGQLTARGEVYGYTSADHELNQVTLAGAGLTTDLEADEDVSLYPLAVRKEALIDADDLEDSEPARIAHGLQGSIEAIVEAGVEDDSVMVRFDDGDYVIYDVIDQEFKVLGRAIEPGTGIPPADDGEPPIDSPDVVALGGVGVIHLRWENVFNGDPLTYEVHMSETPSFLAEPKDSETPSTTWVLDTSSTSASVRTKPDGTKLQYDTLYYFTILAKDSTGYAAQGQGAEASAVMFQVTNEDISASYAYFGEVSVDQLTSGTMSADVTVSGTFRTANEGQRTEIDGLGMRSFRANGSIGLDLPNEGNPRFSGVASLESAVIEDGLELRGRSNTFNMGSRVILETATSGSTNPPSVVSEWPVSPLSLNQPFFNVTGAHLDNEEGGTPEVCYQTWGGSAYSKGAWFHTFPTITSELDGKAHPEFQPTGLVKVVTSIPKYRTVMLGFRNKVRATYPDVLLRSYGTSNDQLTLFGSLKIGDFNWFHNYQIGRVFSVDSSWQNRLAVVMHDEGGDTLSLRLFQVNDDDTVTEVGSPVTVGSTPWNVSNEKLVGCMYGSSSKMKFEGANANVWVLFTTRKAYVYSNTGARRSALDFVLSNGDNSRVIATGNVDDQSNSFHSLRSVAPDGTLRRYSNITWDSSTQTSSHWIPFTWVSQGETYESNPSVPTQYLLKKRAYVRVSVPALPDPAAGKGQPRSAADVHGFRVYMARGDARPTLESQYWKHSTTPVDGELSVLLSTLVLAGTDHPPVVSEFPNQSPAVIESDAFNPLINQPLVKITGDGFAHFENLDVSGGGLASIERLIVLSPENITFQPGNQPALRVGDIQAQHLRIGDTGFVAMADDDTRGRLNFLSKWIYGWDWGLITNVNTNASGEYTFSHGCEGVPDVVLPVGYGFANSRLFQVMSRTATQITINVKNPTTNENWANASISFFWFAAATNPPA